MKMASDKFCILHVVPSFYPAISFGGPIFSTKTICDMTAEHEDFCVKVITTDAANPFNNDRLTEKAIARYHSTTSYEVKYCKSSTSSKFSLSLLLHLYSYIVRADVVHLTGPYSFTILPTMFICRCLKKRVVWSTRGGVLATHQWADVPNRKLKLYFEKLVNYLAKGQHWIVHSTAQIEADVSKKVLPNFSSKIIPNLVSLPNENLIRRKRDPKRIMFLSRIHPKKGIEILLQCLTHLPSEYQLDIYGDGDTEYLIKLKKIISDAHLSSRVRFHGLVVGQKKSDAFSNAGVFCLPSFSENFGIVVAEALSYGVPVVVSNNTPWNIINEYNAGYFGENDISKFVSAILRISNGDYTQFRLNARRLAVDHYSLENKKNVFNDLYSEVIER